MANLNDVNYKACGRLLESRSFRSGRYLVLVESGGVLPYCVAEYLPGSEERQSGTYYQKLDAAARDWENRT